MTLSQALFLVALSIVVVAVAAFTVLVLVSARRYDGGPRPSQALLRRMLRSSRERAELHRWAFYLHRVTGFAVFAFLVLHLADVSLYSFSHGLYDTVHQIYGSWPLRVFECGLLFAVLFHTFNGLRLLAVDVADLGVVASARVLVGVAALTLLIGGVGSGFILYPVLS